MSDDLLRKLRELDSSDACLDGTKMVPLHRNTVRDIADLIERQREALVQCVAVVKMWHGEEVFDIYYEHSPEMALIRAALKDAP